MFEKCYQKNQYIIFKVSDGLVVYNTEKRFKDGHTHLKSFRVAKTIIELSIKRKFPSSHDPYFIDSLIRISDNQEYIFKLKEIKTTRENKTKQKCRKKKDFMK